MRKGQLYKEIIGYGRWKRVPNRIAERFFKERNIPYRPLS